jgi:NAD(P)-dependent dehydrogenase (short-subunit alcohol dehydrogenase family)
VVTGANGGLGLEAARELARKGALWEVSERETGIKFDVGPPSGR